MDFDLEKVTVHPLNGLHNRSRFACRHQAIQNLCRGQLLELHDGRALRAFVALYDNDPRVIGYHYIVLSSVQPEDGRPLGGDVIPGEAYPVVYLVALGVMQRLERPATGRPDRHGSRHAGADAGCDR